MDFLFSFFRSASTTGHILLIIHQDFTKKYINNSEVTFFGNNSRYRLGRPPLGRLGWLPNPSRRRGLAHPPPLLPPPPEDAASLRPEADGGGGGSSSLPHLRGGGTPTCVEVRPI